MIYFLPLYSLYFRPDVVVQNIKEKFWTIIDFSIPLDHNIFTKQAWKVEKYHKLPRFFRTEHGVRTTIIPVVVGAFGSIPVKLPQCLDGVDGAPLSRSEGNPSKRKGTLI